MREPVSKHHVYHKALMYDINVGGLLFDRFFMSDIDLLYRVITILSGVLAFTLEKIFF